MSSMYVNRNGLGAVSLSDIPFIGKAIQWGDAKVQEAVETIVRKYAEFERAASEAPAIKQDAQRILQVLRETGGSPQQISNAVRYDEIANKLAFDASNRGPIDVVVGWVSDMRRQQSMGALPAVPLAIAGAALTASVIMGATIKSWNEGKTMRAMLAAGFTPEQIARTASRGSPFASGLTGATTAISLLALVVGGVFVMNQLKK